MKENPFSCEGRIEKSVLRDHRLSSLGKPRDAKRRSSGRIFLSYPHTHDRFLFSRSITSRISKQREQLDVPMKTAKNQIRLLMNLMGRLKWVPTVCLALVTRTEMLKAGILYPPAGEWLQYETISRWSLTTARLNWTNGLLRLINSMVTELIRPVNYNPGRSQKLIKLELSSCRCSQLESNVENDETEVTPLLPLNTPCIYLLVRGTCPNLRAV